MKFHYFYDMDIGQIEIVEQEGAVCEINLHRADHGETGHSARTGVMRPGVTRQETPLISRAAGQLREYLGGARQSFDIPLAPEGTAFQKEVWDALIRIPYGETRSYAGIAAEAGSPKGARAAGMACHNNPILIMIPCHRVIGKNGSLTGFGGGLDVKEKLLLLEK